MLWSKFSAIFANFGVKMAFFSKTNVMIKILHDLALFRVKNANFFAIFLGENIIKIITSVPGFLKFRKKCFLNHEDVDRNRWKLLNQRLAAPVDN
jgi:hypothetical protein